MSATNTLSLSTILSEHYALNCFVDKMSENGWMKYPKDRGDIFKWLRTNPGPWIYTFWCRVDHLSWLQCNPLGQLVPCACFRHWQAAVVFLKLPEWFLPRQTFLLNIKIRRSRRSLILKSGEVWGVAGTLSRRVGERNWQQVVAEYSTDFDNLDEATTTQRLTSHRISARELDVCFREQNGCHSLTNRSVSVGTIYAMLSDNLSLSVTKTSPFTWCNFGGELLDWLQNSCQVRIIYTPKHVNIGLRLQNTRFPLWEFYLPSHITKKG